MKSLNDRLVDRLTPIFGKMPAVLSDHSDFVRWLREEGVQAFEFHEVLNLPASITKNMLFIPTNEEVSPPYGEWNRVYRGSRVLFMPLLSFCSSLESAKYAMELLAESNFEEAVKENERWLTILMQRKEPMIFAGNGTELSCELEDDVHVMRPRTKAFMSPGEWDSIGTYFEVGMVPNPEDFRPGFVVNGTLQVPGVAVAHRRQMHESLKGSYVRAWEMFEDLHRRGLFPLEVQIENSRVKHVLAGGADLAPELLDLTNKKHDLVLTEMALSTNAALRPERIDWSRNSQFNEGARGIHIGIGDGVSGAHIDFICPGVELLN